MPRYIDCKYFTLVAYCICLSFQLQINLHIKNTCILRAGPSVCFCFLSINPSCSTWKETHMLKLAHLWELLNLLVQLHQLWLRVLLLFSSCRLFPPRLNLHLLISPTPADAVWGGGRYPWGVGSSGHSHSDGAGQGWRRSASARWNSTLSE